MKQLQVKVMYLQFINHENFWLTGLVLQLNSLALSGLIRSHFLHNPSSELNTPMNYEAYNRAWVTLFALCFLALLFVLCFVQFSTYSLSFALKGSSRLEKSLFRKRSIGRSGKTCDL